MVQWVKDLMLSLHSSGHCYGTGLILSLGISTCYRCNPPKLIFIKLEGERERNRRERERERETIEILCFLRFLLLLKRRNLPLGSSLIHSASFTPICIFPTDTSTVTMSLEHFKSHDFKIEFNVIISANQILFIYKMES